MEVTMLYFRVCTVSGLCNSARIDAMLEEETQQFGGDCNICREGAREVKERLQELSQAEITGKMVEICGYFGSFSTACMQTVWENSDVTRAATQSFFVLICQFSRKSTGC